ncbi:MAG TPA: bifunctional phosphoglucose/phosphomannose isomerase [Candidatus Binatia bacterium]|nr:bifunctional phosphoglucose/phosphomannose isomerase [Candidatus Binatia bacterium]
MDPLDDPGARAALDPGGMARAILGMPAQVREAARLGVAIALGEELRGRDAIVVLGMGGSAIAGDLLAGLAADLLSVPLVVSRGHTPPAFVSPRTLVVASSYSGETAETLAAFAEARRRGAPALVLTTGGALGARAAADGLCTIRLPTGFLPRAALAWSYLPLLTALARLGYLPPCDAAIAEAATVLEAGIERLNPDVPTRENPAKQLAHRLTGRIALVYGSEGWCAPVATRWKGQLNENAKHLAWANVLPELDHNEVEGWQHPRALAGAVHLIVLRDPAEPAAVARRIALTTALVQPHLAGVSDVVARGTSPFARQMSLVQMGDFTSLYLALLDGVDPSAMPAITALKASLAR